MSGEEAERMFRNATTWQDADVAVSLASLGECLGEDGKPDVDMVYGEAHRLVTERPYLKASKGSLGSDVPNGPTGMAVGSGRKRHGPPVLNEQRLRDKYKMDND